MTATPTTVDRLVTGGMTSLLRPAHGPAAAGAKPPLLLLLHGVGGNADAMRPIATGIDPRFTVAMPQAPIALGPTSFAWFSVQFTASGPVINPDEAQAAWQRVTRLADELADATDADPSRVFVGGFSQGGIMSLAAMLTAPERFAGAICMSGRLLPEVLPHAASAEALKNKPVLLLHGRQDEKLGIHYARIADAELRARGLDVTLREFDMPHTVTSESMGAASRWLVANS